MRGEEEILKIELKNPKEQNKKRNENPLEKEIPEVKNKEIGDKIVFYREVTPKVLQLITILTEEDACNPDTPEVNQKCMLIEAARQGIFPLPFGGKDGTRE